MTNVSQLTEVMLWSNDSVSNSTIASLPQGEIFDIQQELRAIS